MTKGVDIVATTDFDLGEIGTTSVSLAANYNKTEFDGDLNSLFNVEDQFDFVNGIPNWRGIFTAVHNVGGFTALGRLSYYGPYENSDGGPATVQEFDSEFMLDLELSYSFIDHYKQSIGARNVIHNYPAPGSDAAGETCCGRIYRSDSIVDWQGGYYYGKVEVSF